MRELEATPRTIPDTAVNQLNLEGVNLCPDSAGELENWQAAADFIAAVRESQRLSGKSLRGPNYLTDETQEHLSLFHSSDKIYRTLGEDALLVPTMTRLLERFEEMKRRNNLFSRDTDLDRYTYRLLLLGLFANADVLGGKQGNRISF